MYVLCAGSRQHGSSKEPATPTHPHRSPAKGYPTPEPSLNHYAEGKAKNGFSLKREGTPTPMTSYSWLSWS